MQKFPIAEIQVGIFVNLKLINGIKTSAIIDENHDASGILNPGQKGSEEEPGE